VFTKFPFDSPRMIFGLSLNSSASANGRAIKFWQHLFGPSSGRKYYSGCGTARASTPSPTGLLVCCTRVEVPCRPSATMAAVMLAATEDR
jgi:hypothetical protein